jgi:hypothetical protein
MIVYQ